MAYDEGLAETLRADLADLAGVQEMRMFGGLAFMHRGHMLCGCYRGGAMFRVGRDAMTAALALDGVRQMQMRGRPMGGFVETDAASAGDDALRGRLLGMARDFNATLPPK